MLFWDIGNEGNLDPGNNISLGILDGDGNLISPGTTGSIPGEFISTIFEIDLIIVIGKKLDQLKHENRE